MRWSRLFAPTLRDDPAEADAPSHRLLLRGGYVRRLAPGHYALLPLAARVHAKVTAIVRAEMDAIGAQEMLLPAPGPAMTREEVVASVAREIGSYRRLPQRWYQFRPNVRDEPRPRGGLLRTREFTLHDGYGFDSDRAGTDASPEPYLGAYARIFERLGIPVLACEASGGPLSGETTAFMHPAEAGEDVVVHCPACGYAATAGRAVSALPAVSDEPGPDAPERFATPGVRTIDDLISYGAPADRQIKTLVHVVDDEPALVLLRGDHVLHERKLADATGAARIRAATAEEIRAALGALPGSLGAVGAALPVIADTALRGRRAMVTGANVDETHLRGVDVDRDITVRTWADLREVRAGEPCARCGAPLRTVRAVEVGRVSERGAPGVEVLAPDGGRVPVTMVSCGLGVERAMAAIVEAHHDDRGVVWPLAVAPFQVTVVTAQADDPEVAATAETIYAALGAAGADTVLDDRPERAGVKFRDAELTGIPFRVTLGRRGLADGVAEITTRATGETAKVPLSNVVPHVLALLAAEGAAR